MFAKCLSHWVVTGRKVWPKREELAGEWRELRQGELREFLSTPNITVIKDRKMRYSQHAIHAERKRNECRILVRKHEA